MKKFAVIKNKHGDVFYTRLTEELEEGCRVLHESDDAVLCSILCAIINANNIVLGNDISEPVKETAKALGLNTDDFEELQKALKMSGYEWNLN